jgi:hypothetical protein
VDVWNERATRNISFGWARKDRELDVDVGIDLLGGYAALNLADFNVPHDVGDSGWGDVDVPLLASRRA